jgi:hypothetical protein
MIRLCVKAIYPDHLTVVPAYLPVPVVARSKAQVYGRSPAAIVGSNPTGGMEVCDELITRLEESYRLWRVVVCDHETSWYEEAIARVGLQSQWNNNNNNNARLSMWEHNKTL